MKSGRCPFRAGANRRQLWSVSVQFSDTPPLLRHSTSLFLFLRHRFARSDSRQDLPHRRGQNRRRIAANTRRVRCGFVLQAESPPTITNVMNPFRAAGARDPKCQSQCIGFVRHAPLQQDSPTRNLSTNFNLISFRISVKCHEPNRVPVVGQQGKDNHVEINNARYQRTLVVGGW